MVRCKVCSLIEGKEKILNLKLDGLPKHPKEKKTLIFYPIILASESYISNETNTKEMKGLMLVGVQTLLQSWWSMEGRQKKEKKLSNLWQFFIF
jgi:hypothetical protein